MDNEKTNNTLLKVLPVKTITNKISKLNNNNKIKVLSTSNVNNIEEKYTKRNFPPAIKVWFNSVYNFNKSFTKNLPQADNTVYKIIKGYFTLKPYSDNKNGKKTRLTVKKFRKLSLNRIIVSKPEIKHSSDYVTIKLHVYNKKKNSLLYKLKKLYSTIAWNKISSYKPFHNIKESLKFNKKSNYSNHSQKSVSRTATIPSVKLNSISSILNKPRKLPKNTINNKDLYYNLKINNLLYKDFEYTHNIRTIYYVKKRTHLVMGRKFKFYNKLTKGLMKKIALSSNLKLKSFKIKRSYYSSLLDRYYWFYNTVILFNLKPKVKNFRFWRSVISYKNYTYQDKMKRKFLIKGIGFNYSDNINYSRDTNIKTNAYIKRIVKKINKTNSSKYKFYRKAIKVNNTNKYIAKNIFEDNTLDKERSIIKSFKGVSREVNRENNVSKYLVFKNENNENLSVKLNKNFTYKPKKLFLRNISNYRGFTIKPYKAKHNKIFISMDNLAPILIKKYSLLKRRKSMLSSLKSSNFLINKEIGNNKKSDINTLLQPDINLKNNLPTSLTRYKLYKDKYLLTIKNNSFAVKALSFASKTNDQEKDNLQLDMYKGSSLKLLKLRNIYNTLNKYKLWNNFKESKYTNNITDNTYKTRSIDLKNLSFKTKHNRGINNVSLYKLKTLFITLALYKQYDNSETYLINDIASHHNNNSSLTNVLLDTHLLLKKPIKVNNYKHNSYKKSPKDWIQKVTNTKDIDKFYLKENEKSIVRSKLYKDLIYRSHVIGTLLRFNINYKKGMFSKQKKNNKSIFILPTRQKKWTLITLRYIMLVYIYLFTNSLSLTTFKKVKSLIINNSINSKNMANIMASITEKNAKSILSKLISNNYYSNKLKGSKVLQLSNNNNSVKKNNKSNKVKNYKSETIKKEILYNIKNIQNQIFNYVKKDKRIKSLIRRLPRYKPNYYINKRYIKGIKKATNITVTSLLVKNLLKTYSYLSEVKMGKIVYGVVNYIFSSYRLHNGKLINIKVKKSRSVNKNQNFIDLMKTNLLKKHNYIYNFNKIDKFFAYLVNNDYVNKDNDKSLSLYDNYNGINYAGHAFYDYVKSIAYPYKLKYLSNLLNREMLYIYYTRTLSVNNIVFKNGFINSLCNILSNIYNKKVIINIVNTKYLFFNSDIFTQAIATRMINNRKNGYNKVLKKVLGLVYSAKINEKSYETHSPVYNYIENNKNRYLLLRSELNITNNITDSTMKSNKTLNTKPKDRGIPLKSQKQDLTKNLFVSLPYLNQEMSDQINFIKCKSVFGIKLEASGRLTKRTTASRKIFKVKYLGNLRYNTILNDNKSSYIIKNNLLSNIQFTKISSKTRNGSFGIKGWINNN